MEGIGDDSQVAISGVDTMDSFIHLGSILLRKEEQYAWNGFDRRHNFDAVGCNTHVASQPTVGLLPERRAGRGSVDRGHPAALGSALRCPRTCLMPRAEDGSA